MVDVSSIVVAILSLVGTFLIGIAGLLYTWNTDERKRRFEAENLVAKYRDPLMSAAHDLRSRLYGLSDVGLAEFYRRDRAHRDNLRMYTAFVVGQYLSWTYILRRQAQFLKFSSNKNHNDLTRILAQITDAFATGSSDVFATGPLISDHGANPFRLWRAQQIAIGEIMTIQDGTELYCMGYAAFRKAYHDNSAAGEKDASNNSEGVKTLPNAEDGLNDDLEDPDPDFKSWFQPIIVGTETIAQARCAVIDTGESSYQVIPRGPNEVFISVPDQKIRILQHLLYDLAQTLDPALSAADAHYKAGQSANDRCHRADKCPCSACKDNNICPSPDNRRVNCQFGHGVPRSSEHIVTATGKTRPSRQAQV